MSKDTKTAKTPVKKSTSLYDRIENWSAKNDRKLFYILLILCLFLSFLSFNARISEAHDDALYLEGGWRFVNEFPNYFYTQNAPLYPMFLALLIKLVGFKLILFKLFSVLFNVLGLALLYKALKNRVPAVVFIPVLVFQAACHGILYFASMTFTEAFYFFLQGLFFFYGAKIFDTVKANGFQLKTQFKTWLMLGLSMFLISTCKSSAVVVVPVIILFFILEKNWKAAGAGLVAYLCFKIPYEIIVRSVWHAQNQFSGQGKILLQKDPYNLSLGNEDLAGFVSRFLDNCILYLGRRFYQLIGWKEENSPDASGMVAFITIVIILIGLWFIIKQKNKTILLFALFTGAQTILSFVILQIRWDQPRIIMINMPILLVLMLYAFYNFTKKPGGMGQLIYSALAILLMGSILMSSFKRGLKNLPIVQKNLKGDKYFGYTPDWQNFLKCSEWCADSLPKTSLVASRKAPMSFVYGKGKKFFPIYSVIKKDSLTQQSNPDSALAFFRKNNVTHVMLGSLRVDPNNAGAGIINTVHNIIQPIAIKYPEKLRLVHTQGEFEETSVYEIRY